MGILEDLRLMEFYLYDRGVSTLKAFVMRSSTRESRTVLDVFNIQHP